MNIAIFTNGDSNIGFGHISRTMVLADEFRRRNFYVTFFVPVSCLYHTKITSSGYELIILESFEESYLSTSFLKNKYSIMIVDSVESDYSDLHWINKFGSLLVSITLFDFQKLHRYESISFYPHIGESIRERKDNLTIYSGRDYLTFDLDFANFHSKINRKFAKNVLVTMGGTDPFGLTLQFSHVIKRLPQYNFIILLSERCPTYNLVKNNIEQLENVKMLDFVTDMPKRLSESDIVILNGGLTRYEACVVGTPFIAISIHEKQYKITQQLVDLVGGINLGTYEMLETHKISDEVIKLMENWEEREKITFKMQNLIDVKGAKRICNIIVDTYQKNYEEAH